MEGQEYVYRMKPLVIPGLGYLVLYPLIVGVICVVFYLPEIYLTIFSGIYTGSALLILIIWLNAKSKKIVFEENTIIFRSLFGKQVIEPKDIRKASFFWTKRSDEIVQLKVGKRVYYLTDLYFPFNELLTDLEEFILKYDIRSNLSSHYETN